MKKSQERSVTRLIVMGVSGAGKTTVGDAIATALSVPFIDGDKLHSEENIDKMAQGIPLTDEERWPWLDRISQVICDLDHVVVACSALRKVYRDRLRANAGQDLAFLFLDGGSSILNLRLTTREGHFMKQSMLESQLLTLERPIGEPLVLTCSFDDPVQRIVKQTVTWVEGIEK
ncbi:gluconokinase [Ensifer sp. YR511]|uniref:gluconokinase n=1 Tax=Ensifer sp. YR511 TaxID=1855294 RepID=UPI00088C024C|nr:gluconokinase [Ensifer sp. YR511]SDO07723.1 gluconokinase [Ensifer sp. YR511]